MMYAYMTLPDRTEIVHSEAYQVDGKEQVKVYMEQPVHVGFKTATCYLPEYRWEGVDGFSDAEIAYLKDVIFSCSHLIIRLARERGIEGNASNF